MRRFSKKKFIEDKGQEIYKNNSGWVDLCDGQEVIDGIIKTKMIVEGGNEREAVFMSEPQWEEEY